jgi:hypothetical protein
MSAVLAAAVVVECCGTCGHGRRSAIGIRCAFGKPYDHNGTSRPCVFAPSKWTPVTPATEARREAQEGIDRAVEAADREVASWSDNALAWVKLYATLNRGKRVIGADIVQASIAHKIIQPPNPKAWGGPIQRAARAGYIVKVGTAPDPNRHTNPVPLWECVGA